MIATEAADGVTLVSLLQSGVIAAVVAGAVSLTTWWATGRRARLDRQRQLFADAFEGCIAYREFAYIIRRRVDDSREERARISKELSNVQIRIRSLSARLRVEAPKVSAEYDKLMAETRTVAGKYIKDAWQHEPLDPSETGNIVGIDYSGLNPMEDAYLKAVESHLNRKAW
jgi:hypothetical protein